MKRNFLYTAVSVGSRLLVGLLLFLLLARLWGPAQFGLFSFVFSFSALLVLLVDFGFAVYLLREVAAKPDQAHRLIAEAFRAKLLLMGIAVALLVAGAVLIGPTALPPTLLAPLFLAALAMSFSDFFVSPLRALGRFDLEAALVTLANTLQFLLSGAVAWQGGSPTAVAWSMVLSRAAYLMLARRAAGKVVPHLKLLTSFEQGPMATLRKTWPYGVDGMLATAWNVLDVIVVRALFGTQAVGLYSAGQKIVLGVTAIAPVIGNVMIPRLARLAHSKDPGFWATVRKTSLALQSVGMLFALPLLLVPGPVVALLFGTEYQTLEALLPFFGCLLFTRYFSASAGVVLTAIGEQFRRVVAQLSGIFFIVIFVVFIVFAGLEIRAFMAAYLGGLIVMAAIQHFWVARYRRRWASDSDRT